MKRKDHANGNDVKKRNAFFDAVFPEGIRISWKLFFALLLFTGLILMIVWVFQIRLLNLFYERIKREELTNGADMVETYLEREDLEAVAAILREREIVHYQRFGDALRIAQEKLDSKNFYAINPAFDKGCNK